MAEEKFELVLADFIAFEQDLDAGNINCKTLLLPNPYLLSLKQYKNLKKWVAGGGTLITEARFGQKDENGHLYPKPLLEDLLGETFEYTVPIKEGFYVGLRGKAKKLRIVQKKIGKGKVVYANFSVFLEIKNGNRNLLNSVKKEI